MNNKELYRYKISYQIQKKKTQCSSFKIAKREKLKINLNKNKKLDIHARKKSHMYKKSLESAFTYMYQISEP